MTPAGRPGATARRAWIPLLCGLCLAACERAPDRASGLAGLLQDLGSEDAGTRRDAVLAIAASDAAARDRCSALMTALRDGDPLVRAFAAEGLGTLGEDAMAAVPMLLQLQTDSEAYVGERALEALNRVNPPPDVAVRDPVDPVYETVRGRAPLQPARTEWQRVECAADATPRLPPGASCWRLVEVPAVHASPETKVLVRASGWRWRAGRPEDRPEPILFPAASAPAQPPPVQGPPDALGRALSEALRRAKPGETWCYVTIPAVYETVTDRVLVKAERREVREGREVEVPAEYEMRSFQRLVSPERAELIRYLPCAVPPAPGAPPSPEAQACGAACGGK